MISIKLEISIFIASLINTIQCFNISLRESESVNSTETINNNSSCDDNDDNKNNSNSNRKSIPIMLPKTQQLLLEYCMCISCVCLTMHLIVYAFVPKLQTTPGKSLMSLSLSLLLAAIMFIISFHIEADPFSYVCVSIGFIRFYTFLGKFFTILTLIVSVEIISDSSYFHLKFPWKIPWKFSHILSILYFTFRFLLLPIKSIFSCPSS